MPHFENQERGAGHEVTEDDLWEERYRLGFIHRKRLRRNRITFFILGLAVGIGAQLLI